MELLITRFFHGTDSTAGTLRIDEKFQCFTLEDEYRQEKLWGETRIPDGTYKIRLKTKGSMAEKYQNRFTWHKGMLELKNVPNFNSICIHIGNTDDDTSGCILVGNSCNFQDEECSIFNSVDAYKALYRKVYRAMQLKELVYAKIISL